MQEEEFKQVDEKLAVIRDMLENGKVKRKTDLPPYKTRLIHLIFRLVRLKESGFDTQELELVASQLYNDFFSLLSTDPDASKIAGEMLVDEISKISIRGEEGDKTDSENTDENAWEDQLVMSKKGKTSTPRRVKAVRKRKPIDARRVVKLVLDQVDQHLERRLSCLNIATHPGTPTSEQIIVMENPKPKPPSVRQSRSVERKKSKERQCTNSHSSASLTEEEPRLKAKSRGRSTSSSGDSYQEKKRKGLKRRPRPVADWKIKYDGKDDGKSLNKFVTEVEFMAEAEQLTKKDLFKEAIHLFSGDVRTWYMEGKKNKDFTNWNELVTELKLEYQPPDLDFHYEQQAALRRQKRSEKFTDYYNAIKEIFTCMSVPPSEERKFDIVFRNLRSDYKNALVVKNVRTLSTLKTWGRKLDSANWAMYRSKEVEHTQKSAQAYEVYRKPGQTLGNPSVKKEWNAQDTGKKQNCSKQQMSPGSSKKSYAKPQNSKHTKSACSQEPAQDGSSKASLEKRIAEYHVPDRSTCFNCRGQNHWFSSCLLPREKFCSSCGFHDFTAADCPFCAKNVHRSA